MRRLAHVFRPDQDRPDTFDRPDKPDRPDRLDRPDRPDKSDRPNRLAAYNTYDARNVLSQLITRSAAGEEIVIARSGVPVAKLVPYAGEPCRPGVVRTQVIVLGRGESESEA